MFIIINDQCDILESAQDFKSGLIMFFNMINWLKSYAEVIDLSPCTIKVNWIYGASEIIKFEHVKRTYENDNS